MKKIAKILTVSAFLLAASNVNAQDVLNKSIADLNRMFPSRVSIPSDVAHNLFLKGSGAMNVNISQFKATSDTAIANNSLNQSDINAQDRDFIQNESMTESPDLQEPNTLQNTDVTNTDTNKENVNADFESTDLIKNDSDMPNDVHHSNINMDNKSVESSDIKSDDANVVRQDFVLQPEDNKQAVDQVDQSSDVDHTTTTTNQTERERLSKD